MLQKLVHLLGRNEKRVQVVESKSGPRYLAGSILEQNFMGSPIDFGIFLSEPGFSQDQVVFQGSYIKLTFFFIIFRVRQDTGTD